MFKRRTQHGGDELTASMPLDLAAPSDAKYFRNILGVSRSVGQRPWKWYKEIGEIHYAVSRSARIAGYANLYVCKRNPDGTPGDMVTRGKLGQIGEMLYSPYGGTRGLCDRFFTLMKVPGDAYLIKNRDGKDFDGFEFISALEIDRESSGANNSYRGETDLVYEPGTTLKRITLPKHGSTTGEELYREIASQDFVGRVWRPSTEYVDMPDSPLRSLDHQCEILNLLTINMKAKLLNRFALAGLLFIPSEINQVSGTQPDRGAAGAQANEVFHDNQVLNAFIRAMTWAVMNHEDPRSAIPILMTGPGDLGDKIKLIFNDPAIAETDMKLRGELIDRILMGLDIQPQDVKGIGDSNHWSAWAVSDDERRINIQPDIETLCFALTRMVLNREGKEMGLTDATLNKHMVWYDLTDANVKTNLAEDGRQLRDRLLVSDKATRRTSGMSESDAPTPEEQVRMVGVKTGNPYLALFGLPIANDIDWEMVIEVGKGKSGPDADSPAGESKVGPGVGAPGSPSKADKKNNGPARGRPA